MRCIDNKGRSPSMKKRNLEFIVMILACLFIGFIGFIVWSNWGLIDGIIGVIISFLITKYFFIPIAGFIFDIDFFDDKDNEKNISFSKKNFISVLLVIWTLSLPIIFIYSLFQDPDMNPLNNYEKLKPFESHLSEYTSISGFKNDDGMYIKGKIIPIDKEPNYSSISYSYYFRLPEELRATQPEEVGTIVLLERSDERVGTYTDGAGAYVTTIEVTIIDKSIPMIIGRKSFRGENPLSAKYGYGANYGLPPTIEIIDFLKGLPRR